MQTRVTPCGLQAQTSLGTLLGNEGLTGSLGATGMFNLPHLLPQNSLISSKVLDQSAAAIVIFAHQTCQ